MNPRSLALVVAGLAFAGPGAHANFHQMQIEQIIGGVNGNTSAQAIQLRLRFSNQNVVSNASLWAWDAGGLNRTLLLDIETNVSNGAQGARVLLTTSAFNSAMIAGGATTFTPDFTLANAIPSSYLTAGRLTFEDDFGSIYWSLSWGGAGYSGSQSGDFTNDGDEDFGPAFGSALPTSRRQGVRFTGTAAAASTTNLADYALTANPATVTKNNGTAFTVVPEPGIAALFGVGALYLGGTCWRRRRA